EQAFQDGDLLRAERQASPGAVGETSFGVHGQVAVAQVFRLRSAGPTAQRLDPGDHLGEVGRLGQVVVSAQAEPLDTVFDRAGGGEHQHPALTSLGGKGAADVVAVGAG